MTGKKIDSLSPGNRRHVADRLPPWKNLAFSVLPLLLLAITGEVAVRAVNGRLLDPGNARASRIRLERRGYPWQPHPVLGYVPAPTGTVSKGKRSRLTIRRNGLRSNASRRIPDRTPILAVGDSMTFGDGVADADTWPAHLQRLVDRPVLNAGVFGYGVDQMTLRAEMLVPEVRPSVLVADVNPAAVFRCQLSCGAAPKPFFRIQDDALSLSNVPVPPPSFDGASGLKHALGYSHLADAFLGRFARNWWLLDIVPTQAHDRAGDVAALLLDRLVDLCDSHRCRLVLMVHPTLMKPELCRPMLRRARERAVAVLDLASVAAARIARDPALVERWFQEDGHTSAAGNEWVARRLASFLARQGLIETPPRGEAAGRGEARVES